MGCEKCNSNGKSQLQQAVYLLGAHFKNDPWHASGIRGHVEKKPRVLKLSKASIEDMLVNRVGDFGSA